MTGEKTPHLVPYVYLTYPSYRFHGRTKQFVSLSVTSYSIFVTRSCRFIVEFHRRFSSRIHQIPECWPHSKEHPSFHRFRNEVCQAGYQTWMSPPQCASGVVACKCTQCFEAIDVRIKITAAWYPFIKTPKYTFPSLFPIFQYFKHVQPNFCFPARPLRASCEARWGQSQHWRRERRHSLPGVSIGWLTSPLCRAWYIWRTTVWISTFLFTVRVTIYLDHVCCTLSVCLFSSMDGISNIPFSSLPLTYNHLFFFRWFTVVPRPTASPLPPRSGRSVVSVIPRFFRIRRPRRFAFSFARRRPRRSSSTTLVCIEFNFCLYIYTCVGCICSFCFSVLHSTLVPYYIYTVLLTLINASVFRYFYQSPLLPSNPISEVIRPGLGLAWTSPMRNPLCILSLFVSRAPRVGILRLNWPRSPNLSLASGHCARCHLFVCLSSAS